MTIHVGLIGAGNISDTHARAAAAIAGVKLTAVHAPTRDHAVRLASAHGATAYDTLDAFLDHRPMDLVAIGSPSGLHGEHGIAAVRRRLHVLVHCCCTSRRSPACGHRACDTGRHPMEDADVLGFCGRVHRNRVCLGGRPSSPQGRPEDGVGSCLVR